MYRYILNIRKQPVKNIFCRYLSSKLDNVQYLVNGILCRDRARLAESITLIESSHPTKRKLAQELLKELLKVRKNNHNSYRIGISGAPGVGKSTFIEAIGKMLTSNHHRVAVLAVDPSSMTTGGSLLGDKTRMPELTRDPNAYIRPSPSKGALGGVTRNTNDAIVVCEAAGYDTILVETVGVGQSEFAVSEMVDMFVLLISPASGDELQGIKRGIMEVADLIVVTKNDGDLMPAAKRIKAEYISASKFLRSRRAPLWKPKVLTASSTEKHGIDEVWKQIELFFETVKNSGEFLNERKKQHSLWMWNYIKYEIVEIFKSNVAIKKEMSFYEEQVTKGIITPGLAADELLTIFLKSRFETKNEG